MSGKHSEDNKKRTKYTSYAEDELPKAFRKQSEEETIPKALRKENNHEEPQRGSVEKMKKEKKRKHRKLKIFGKIVLTLIIILAVLLGTAYWYITNKDDDYGSCRSAVYYGKENDIKKYFVV